MQNPFKRITYSEQEREVSKQVWNMFHDFWEQLAPLTPDGPEKTLVMRKLQEASYMWEVANTAKVKQARGELSGQA